MRVPDVPGCGGSPSELGMRCSCAASSSSAADGQKLEAYTQPRNHLTFLEMVLWTTAKGGSDGTAHQEYLHAQT